MSVQGGIPGLRFLGGSQVSDFWGVPGLRFFWGVPGLRFLGGVPGLRLSGGVPSLSKGKNFWHQIWLDTCSDWGKKIFQRDPPQVKGKIFDTRFGLIHVQTGVKKFSEGPPPPQEREKILTPDLAWYMFRLGKKNFVKGPHPLRNSKKLLWPCSRWYASCVHAGGLSCWTYFSFKSHEVVWELND